MLSAEVQTVGYWVQFRITYEENLLKLQQINLCE